MNGKITVIHRFPVWLPQTQTWMYNQVKFLPDEIEAHVVCEHTKNLKQFYVKNIHNLYRESGLQYYYDRILNKLGIFRIQQKENLYRDFLIKTIKHTHTHIVHSHFGNYAWHNIAALKQTETKHIVSFYGYDVSMLPTKDSNWKIRYKELFNETALFLCEGPHLKKSLVNLGCPNNKILIHHLGIDLSDIKYRPRKWQSKEPLNILIAGSFREKKGIPYALRALSKLKGIVKLQITIVGDASGEKRSQEEKRQIVETITDTGLTTHIKMLGYLSYKELLDEAYKNHIFISPSVTAKNGDTEGGAPVTIIEMMATGMPVVSTTHCDIPEVVQYEIDNWLAPERDVKALISKLKWLIEHPYYWGNMLDKGRKHIEWEYDAEKQGKKLSEIYNSLINNL